MRVVIELSSDGNNYKLHASVLEKMEQKPPVTLSGCCGEMWC